MGSGVIDVPIPELRYANMPAMQHIEVFTGRSGNETGFKFTLDPKKLGDLNKFPEAVLDLILQLVKDYNEKKSNSDLNVTKFEFGYTLNGQYRKFDISAEPGQMIIIDDEMRNSIIRFFASYNSTDPLVLTFLEHYR